MRKKWTVTLTSLTLAAAMAAVLGGQALAADWLPSRTQSEVGVAESTTTTTSGTTVTVVTTTTVEDAGSTQQVEGTSSAVIQITPVSVTLAANAAVDAANPGATGEQLASTATGSGLTYAANGQLNNLYNEVTAAETTEQLLTTTAPAAAATFETVVGTTANDYTPIALYQVAASPAAVEAIAESGSVTIAISVPGVGDNVQLVAICWDSNGNSRVVPVTVVNGVVYLSVYSSGPVMIMARAQVQA